MKSQKPVGEAGGSAVSRRTFLQTTSAGAAVLAAGAYSPLAYAKNVSEAKTPESLVGVLYDTLNDKQKSIVAFDWDHTEEKRGLLRTRVSNNWHITKPPIGSDFFTGEQQKLIRSIFEGLIQPEWHAKFYKQLQDDAGGFGRSQNIALFGKPGDGDFEFVMTGRHMTLRCDGNSADHVAFGGPIFYGHAAQGFNEKPDHPGNVFWEQALAANKVYQMLDGKQRKRAEESETPYEGDAEFVGQDGDFLGIPVADLSADQQAEVGKVLNKLIEPYRQSDQDEVVACLKSQGGLNKCHLAFFTDGDIGNDRVWDNWRLEGPSFVWHFRGAPHVHVWVNVANDASVKLNA